MTTEIDLLPMPKPEGSGLYRAWSYDQMRDYARANVARAVAPLQAEIDALRTRLEDTVRDSTNKIEALRTEAEQHFQQAMSNGAKARAAQAQANNLRTEIEALRAEVERLRADRDSWEQQASDRVADWHAEHLRAERLAEALRRAHRWGGLGKGWDSGVALDLIAWIESGMHGELPPLPDYLAAALAQEDRND